MGERETGRLIVLLCTFAAGGEAASEAQTAMTSPGGASARGGRQTY